MRHAKIAGFGAIAIVAAMTFMGVTSASAKEPTLLCNAQHVEGSKCPTGQATLEFTVKGVLDAATQSRGTLLNATANVLCLTVEGNLHALALGNNTQEVHVKKLLLDGCGTNSAHSNCEVTVEELPLFLVLKTELNFGVGISHGGKVRVKCTIFGFIKIDCTYTSSLEKEEAVEGALYDVSAGHGMLTLSKSSAILVAGGGLCPEDPLLDALVEPTQHIWITDGGNAVNTALCKTHSTSCAKEDQVEALHLVAAEPTVLLNGVANVECDESLVSANALGLSASPEQAHVTKWTWGECHTLGATGNCEVTTEALPLIDVSRTSLNVGTATVLGIEVAVHCNVLGLHEMECSFGGDVTLSVEGALQTEGAGHGMFTADEVELEELSEVESCPDEAKWSALYEPLEHVFIIR